MPADLRIRRLAGKVHPMPPVSGWTRCGCRIEFYLATQTPRMPWIGVSQDAEVTCRRCLRAMERAATRDGEVVGGGR